VVTSLLHDNQFHAALAIDIMDRQSLRARQRLPLVALAPRSPTCCRVRNCRAGCEDHRLDPSHHQRAYTVYSNLLVLTPMAGSSPRRIRRRRSRGPHAVDEWVARILALRDTQGYAVSAFAPTPLYEGRHTYIYGAAIRTPATPAGGRRVAIVFDPSRNSPPC